MGREKLLLIFRIENYYLCGIVMIISLIVIFSAQSSYETGLGVGMFIGIFAGGIINDRWQIPKVYGEKDERELTLLVIATSLSVGFGGVLFASLFVLSISGVFDLGRTVGYGVFFVIILLMLLIRLVANKVLQRIN